MENERDGGIDKQQIKSVLDHALLRLREEGCVYSKDLTHMIRTQPAKALRQLYKELDKHIKSKGYKYYFTNRKLGKLIYDPDQFSDQAIKYVYKLHISMSKLQEQTTKCISEEKIRKLITKQCSKLPCAVSYDYRKLVDRSGSLNAEALDEHFDPDLNDFVEKITTSDKSKHRVEEGSTSYKRLRKLRIRMIICMLCMAMNPATSFFQTLLGVIAYMFGLRDRGFDILNAFGILSSVDQVRKHGSYWSKKRCVTDELNRTAFWRVSFDNLNFKMKFAKCLGSTLDGIKKKLNLITAQISTRKAQD